MTKRQPKAKGKAGAAAEARRALTLVQPGDEAAA